MKRIQPAVSWLIRGITNILFRIDQVPLQMVPKHGPLILVMNHIGSLEVPLLYSHLQPRRIIGVVKVETWDNPLMGWLFDVWEAIPIRRGEVDMDAFHRSLDVLAVGEMLGVAPEGTRSYHGRLQRARPGVVILALHSGAPILPVAHWGGEKLSCNLKRMKRTDFHIKVGRPFYLEANDGKATRVIRQEMVDEVMGQIAALLPVEYRGEYANLGATTKYLRFT
jgi:1-acyl-sn-glycerol-3-phosphate acyltransferase